MCLQDVHNATAAQLKLQHGVMAQGHGLLETQHKKAAASTPLLQALHMPCDWSGRSHFARGIVEGRLGSLGFRLAGGQLLAQLPLSLAAGFEVKLEAGQLLPKLLRLI